MELHFAMNKDKGFPVDVYVEYNSQNIVDTLIPLKDICDYLEVDYEEALKLKSSGTNTHIFMSRLCVTEYEMLLFGSDIKELIDITNDTEVGDYISKMFYIYDTCHKFKDPKYVMTYNLKTTNHSLN